MSAEFDHYAGRYEDLLKDPIRDRFTKNSEFFHRRKWLLIRRFFQKQRRRTTELAWLDVGCGKGELLRFGHKEFARAVGCDPSLEMLRDCSGLEVAPQTDAATLPFPDRSFDFVTAVCVYHHLEPAAREAMTRDARRVLKPGGVFAIFEHNPWNPATRLIVSRTPVDANAVLLTARETRRLMARAGFRDARTTYYLYFPEPLFNRLGVLENFLAAAPAGGQYAVFARLEE